MAPPEPPEILDLGRGWVDADPIPGRSTRSWVSLICLALVAGLVAGALSMRSWDDHRHRLMADRALDVRVSLGASGGVTEADSRRVVLAVSLVLLNAGRRPVVLVGFEVTGPGAGLITSPAGGPSTDVPQTLDPGRPMTNRIGLTSDCSVAVRPLPTVVILLRDADGRLVRRKVWIPDLDSLWGQTLLSNACPEREDA